MVSYIIYIVCRGKMQCAGCADIRAVDAAKEYFSLNMNYKLSMAEFYCASYHGVYIAPMGALSPVYICIYIPRYINVNCLYIYVDCTESSSRYDSDDGFWLY